MSSLANSGYKKIVIIYKTLTFVNGYADVTFDSIGTSNYFIVSKPSGGLVPIGYPDANRTPSSFRVGVMFVKTNTQSIDYAYNGEFPMQFALIVY